MKRLPEFILGLTGAILGLLVSLGVGILIFAVVYNDFGLPEQLIRVSSISCIIGGIIGILTIICICFIEKKIKIVSIMLIILAILFIFTNLLQIISSILLIIAGIMGLIRKVD
ncbi:hypothetical protein HH195_11420 (plasmid) [Sarcina sp. JB2]|uniref:Uncharacterized protein n=1 Tax=Candidatus Sarcina troglodytae TaxID=2726954 RepID=A0ACD1BG80_9CLOT|nr:hypothetical protein [Sarcina sp. JB2]QPJ86575.1 hypothetical protein HH195_11420 [Sarcina sp. JB2]